MSQPSSKTNDPTVQVRCTLKPKSMAILAKTWIQRAMEYLKEYRYSEALLSLETANILDSKSLDAGHQLIRKLIRTGKLQKTHKMVLEAIYPPGKNHNNTSDVNKESAHLTRSDNCVVDPGRFVAKVWALRGMTYVSKHRWIKAFLCFETAFILNSKSLDLQQRIIRSLIHSGQIQEAYQIALCTDSLDRQFSSTG